MTKRGLSMLLAVLMVLSMAFPAYAAEEPQEPVVTEEPAPEGEAAPEEPTDTPAEEPTDTPVDEPTDAPAEEPTDAPAEEPTDAPAEEPTDAPAEEPTDAPAEEPTDTPAEQPTEAPAEQPAETPVEQPTEVPAEQPAEAPAEQPTEVPAEEPEEEPAEEPEEEPEPVAVDEPAAIAEDGDGSSAENRKEIKSAEDFSGAGEGIFYAQLTADALTSALTINAEGKTINLDLGENTSAANGLTISAGDVTISGGSMTVSNGAAVTVNGGSLTIEDGAITGETIGVNVTSGKATITGGTIKATREADNGYAVKIESGSADITGGVLDGSRFGVLSYCPLTVGGSAEIKGETASGLSVQGGTTTINGGTITGKLYGIVAGESANVTVTDGTIKGGDAASNGGVQAIGTSTVTIENGKISGNTGVVTMNTGKIEITGGMITGGNGGGANATSGTIDIKNGTIKGPSGASAVGGTVTISGGTVTGTDEDGFGACASNGGILTISGGTVEGTNGYGAVITNPKSGGAGNSKVTITGGDIKGSVAAVSINGATTGGEMTIKNGTFTGGVAGAYIAAGSFTMSGGTMTGTNGAGIVARGSTVNVTGGSVTAGGTDPVSIGDAANPEVPSAALVVDKQSSGYGNNSVTVSDGTFKAVDGQDAVTFTENGQEAESVPADNKLEVSGGTFSASVKDYVPADKASVSVDGEYYVGAKATETVEKLEPGAVVTVEQAPADGITVPSGVEVDNKTGGDIKVNGTEVAKDKDYVNHNGTVHEVGTMTKVPAEAATCTKDGVKEHWTCSGCKNLFADEAGSKVLTEAELVDPAKGHTLGEKYESDKDSHWKVCTVCGEKIGTEAHKWNAEKATETEDKHCTVCGYVAEEKLPAPSAPPAALQPAPTVKAAASDGSVSVSWTAVTGAAKYRVYYREVGGKTWKVIANTKELSCTWKQGVSGKTYEFTVRGIDANNKHMSEYKASNAVEYTVKYQAAPTVKASLGEKGVALSWTAVTGAAKYRVYYRVKGGKTWHVIGNTTKLSYTWKQAASGKTYEFTVRGIDGKNAHLSDYKTSGMIKYVAAPKIEASLGEEGVALSWTKVTGAARYRVYYRVDGGAWKTIGSTTKLSYTWKKAESGKTYEFAVRGLDGKGAHMSAYRASAAVAYMAAPTVKAARSGSGVSVSWTAVTGAAKYRVYYREVGGKTWKVIANTRELSCTWKQGVSGRTYEFTVRGIDGKNAHMSAYKASAAVRLAR